MSSELVKLSKLSGKVTSYYSICLNGSEDTLYDEFSKTHMNIKAYRQKMGITTVQLYSMALTFGAKIHAFEPNDPLPENRVCYLNLRHWTDLRLYCIWYSRHLVILGGGVIIDSKPKSKSKLDLLIDTMGKISHKIETSRGKGALKISVNQKEFEGDLIL